MQLWVGQDQEHQRDVLVRQQDATVHSLKLVFVSVLKSERVN